jgi:sugar diacid utilization regulator
MVEASRVVALTMLRARLASDSSVALRQALVSMLLDGGSRAREAAGQLDVSASAGCVIALGPHAVDGANEARSESELQRVTSALNMYLQPISPRAVAALLGGTIYAVLPFASAGSAAQDRAVGLATEFVERIQTQGRFSVGVGSVAPSILDLATSRSDADGALRVLRSRAADRSSVATVDSVQVEWLMLQISDSFAADGITASGPLADLRAHDREHGTEYVETLRTWLDNLGDVRTAAESLHVHVNTFRYRLRRLTEIAGVDLSNADSRFGLMLQLRLLDH